MRRLARENGLLFPPDPGAAEQSQIGGNIATNAGGPHAFKYGVTGDWVTGLEAVVAPGELVRVGGPIRKDVAGYDLGEPRSSARRGRSASSPRRGCGSRPAPEAALARRLAFTPAPRAGCDALERVLGSGLPVAALEYLDGETLAALGRVVPGRRSTRRGFLVLDRGRRLAPKRSHGSGEAVLEVLGEDAISICGARDGRARSRRCGAGATASRSRCRRSAAAR